MMVCVGGAVKIGCWQLPVLFIERARLRGMLVLGCRRDGFIR